MSAKDSQVGGEHYKNLKIQPIDYIIQNGLNFQDGNVVKYISRHRSKNGAEDVRKAMHYCQLILQIEYGITDDENNKLRRLVSRLYNWVHDLPVKHPDQEKLRQEAKKVSDHQ